MIKKEYKAPVVKVCPIEVNVSILDASPSEWDIINGPGGNGNQTEDDSEESL